MTSESTRGRLLARQRPTLSYPLLVDHAGAHAAQVRLNDGQAQLRQLILSGAKTSSAEYKRVVAELAQAQAQLQACYELITLQALPTDGDVTVEKLIAAHPPSAAQLAEARKERDVAKQRGDELPNWPQWDADTFQPALLEACTAADMSAADWTTFLTTNLSQGERIGLWKAALAVNSLERVADAVVLPKGWTPTNS